jgi:enoyl-CoA hydratase
MPAPVSPDVGRDASGVRIHRSPPVLVMTIDRIHVRNAVDLAAAEALAAALAALDDDPELAVGVLTGAGGVFCAGKDLKSVALGEPEAFVGDRGFAGLTRRQPCRPLIAAVEGPALGGGFELALACDLIVAARDAVFGQPEVTRGLVATEGGMVRLPRRLPHAIAMELLLTGDRLTAPEAARWGLVNRLTPPGGALAAALELAAQIAGNAPLALRTTTAVVRAIAGLPERTAFAVQDELTAPLWGSADIDEGYRAFFERREPHWQGR